MHESVLSAKADEVSKKELDLMHITQIKLQLEKEIRDKRDFLSKMQREVSELAKLKEFETSLKKQDAVVKEKLD